MHKLIDTHCHLSSVPNSGLVSGFVCNATTESEWNVILNTSRQHTNIYPAIGLHPWYVSDAKHGWNLRLEDLLVHNPKAMIGECGLDKLYPDFNRQCTVFLKHLEIANLLCRGINIHCVRAWGELFNMLHDCYDVPAIILHGFSGSAEIVEQFQKMPNVYFCFGPYVMDARRAKLQQALCKVAKNRLLVESDKTMSESENILIRVATYVTKHVDIDFAQLYNNAQEILNDGQIT